MWAAALELPSLGSNFSHFPRKESTASKGACTPQRQRSPALSQLCLPPSRPADASHFSLNPSFTFGTVETDRVRSAQRKCSRSPKGPCGKIVCSEATSSLREASRFTQRPHGHSLCPVPLLCLAFEISWGLESSGASAGCPEDWLLVLIARSGSPPTPLPRGPESAPCPPAPPRAS